MPYGETKVYFDGSHYIAIPHTENPHKRTRYKEPEEEITVADSKVQETAAESKRTEEVGTTENDVPSFDENITETVDKEADVKPQKEVKITKKQLFDKPDNFLSDLLLTLVIENTTFFILEYLRIIYLPFGRGNESTEKSHYLFFFRSLSPKSADQKKILRK